MKIISFAWTTAALLAGHKTVTRRDWDDSYAARFKPDEIVQAYNRSPRHRGECVALIRILSVTKEPNADMPDSDYEAEGFRWYAENPDQLPKKDRFAYLDGVSWEAFDSWRQSGGESWVIRFTLWKVL